MNINDTKFRFILLRGPLGWGIPTAILFQLIMHLTGEQDFFDGIISSLIIFPLVGILFGYLMWHSKHKKN
jgi:phosphate/sulfate permease